jgi:hypothetical protein
VRVQILTAALIGCAAAFGAASDETEGAGRPPWRVYKVAPVTWSVSKNVVSSLRDGTDCRTPASLTARSSPFYAGTPATKKVTSFRVRISKTRSALAYGRRAKWPFVVPAQMTLTVGPTTCDSGADGGSCEGTYHSRGGILGYVTWEESQLRDRPSQMVWSHKIDMADHRPPMSCGQDVGGAVYGLFFGGIYHPVGGGAFEGSKDVPLQRSRLVLGKRFTSSRTRTFEGDDENTIIRTKATFTPVPAPG